MMFQIDVLCICEWMDVLMDVDGFGGIMIISFMISDAVLCRILYSFYPCYGFSLWVLHSKVFKEANSF